MPSKLLHYAIWNEMHRRCDDPFHPKYERYGARGISVCERWNMLENFVADMGAKPEGGTLERKDNDGNYEPSNCCWATYKEQARNRSNNKLNEQRRIELVKRRDAGETFQSIADRFDCAKSTIIRAYQDREGAV